MTSEERRLIGEVAPCPSPTTSSTLLLLHLFPLVPTPSLFTAIPSPRKVRKLDQRSVRPSARDFERWMNGWVTWFARSGGRERGQGSKVLPALASSAVPACSCCLVAILQAAPFGMRSLWRQRVEICCCFPLLASCDCLWISVPACLPVLWTCQLPCSGGIRRVQHHAARQSLYSAHVGSTRQCSVRGPKLHDWPSVCCATTTKHTQSRCPP